MPCCWTCLGLLPAVLFFSLGWWSSRHAKDLDRIMITKMFLKLGVGLQPSSFRALHKCIQSVLRESTYSLRNCILAYLECRLISYILEGTQINGPCSLNTSPEVLGKCACSQLPINGRGSRVISLIETSMSLIFELYSLSWDLILEKCRVDVGVSRNYLIRQKCPWILP